MKVTSLFSVIKAKYQLQHYGTAGKKKLNIIIYVSGQKISLV